MKLIFSVLIIFFSFNLFAQTKKEQIEVLKYRLDSINNLLFTERSINDGKTNQLIDMNTKLSLTNNEFNLFKNKFDNLNSDLQNRNLTIEFFKKTIDSQQNVIINTTSKILLLHDSINFFRTNQNNLLLHAQKLQQKIDSQKVIISDLTSKFNNGIKSNVVNSPKQINNIKKLVLGSRELKIGDSIKFDDPDTYNWEAIDMSTHYVLYRTPDGFEVQIGASGSRYLKIESITPNK
jgi:hypothetical protein